jgi:hypothetical protein
MGIGYATIKWTLGTKEYNTQHSWARAPFSLPGGGFDSSDANDIGFSQLGDGDLDGRTDPQDVSFGPDSLLERIIALHRAVQGGGVVLTQLYLHDGPTNGTETGAFATFPLNLTCRNVTLAVGLEDYAPANCALLVDKSPATISSHAGRIWFRGALLKDEIILTAEDGVGLTVDGKARAEADLLSGYIEGGVSVGGLSLHFGAGFNGVGDGNLCQYGVCQTQPVDPDDPDGPRQIDGFTAINKLSVDDAQSRDTRRRLKSTDDEETLMLRLYRYEKRLKAQGAKAALREQFDAIRERFGYSPVKGA